MAGFGLDEIARALKEKLSPTRIIKGSNSNQNTFKGVAGLATQGTPPPPPMPSSLQGMGQPQGMGGPSVDPRMLSELDMINRQYELALQEYANRMQQSQVEAENRRAPVRRDIGIQQDFMGRGEGAINDVYGQLQERLGGLVPVAQQNAAESVQGTQQAFGSGQQGITQGVQALQAALAQAKVNPTGQATSGTDLAQQQLTQAGTENVAGASKLGDALIGLSQRAVSEVDPERAYRVGLHQDRTRAEIANLQQQLAGITPDTVNDPRAALSLDHEKSIRGLLDQYGQGEDKRYNNLEGVEQYFADNGQQNLGSTFRDILRDVSTTSSREFDPATGSSYSPDEQQQFFRKIVQEGDNASRYMVSKGASQDEAQAKAKQIIDQLEKAYLIYSGNYSSYAQ